MKSKVSSICTPHAKSKTISLSFSIECSKEEWRRVMEFKSLRCYNFHHKLLGMLKIIWKFTKNLMIGPVSRIMDLARKKLEKSAKLFKKCIAK